MDEKPKINLRRFQSEKIKAKYVIKFGLYVLVFVFLFFWYKKQKEDQQQKIKKVSDQTINSENVELIDLKIEP